MTDQRTEQEKKDFYFYIINMDFRLKGRAVKPEAWNLVQRRFGEQTMEKWCHDTQYLPREIRSQIMHGSEEACSNHNLSLEVDHPPTYLAVKPIIDKDGNILKYVVRSKFSPCWLLKSRNEHLFKFWNDMMLTEFAEDIFECLNGSPNRKESINKLERKFRELDLEYPGVISASGLLQIEKRSEEQE